MNVNLEWFEVSRAALVGVSRQVEAMRKGLKNTLEANDEWSAHILGALGECAFAKATNRYWNGSVNTFTVGGDVGARMQIRTRSRHTYDLIVREKDDDNDCYVLVTGGPDNFQIHGWMLARDAKKQQYLANYGNYGQAYFVPKSALQSPQSLVVEPCSHE
jgi:hypothetical protein